MRSHGTANVFVCGAGRVLARSKTDSCRAFSGICDPHGTSIFITLHVFCPFDEGFQGFLRVRKPSVLLLLLVRAHNSCTIFHKLGEPCRIKVIICDNLVPDQNAAIYDSIRANRESRTTTCACSHRAVLSGVLHTRR